MKRYKRIALLILVLAVGLMVYSGEQWLSIDKVYQEANDAYADYSQVVRRLPANGSADPPGNGGAEAGDIRQADLHIGGDGTAGGARQGDTFLTGDAAVNDTGQNNAYPVVTPSPSYSAAEGDNNGVTWTPINNEQQDALTPEPPHGTAPAQDAPAQGEEFHNNYQNNFQNNDTQGGDPQGGNTDHAQSASPVPAREDVRATPAPTPTPTPVATAVIAAPEMTPPTATPTPLATPTPQTTPDNNSPIDFNALKAINRDAVAWLYSPNTVIDYPVMRTNDYSYYLDRLPDGRKNANGSLFIDYNTPSDFSGALTVIYGHNMKSGKMFGSLPSYKSQSYYNQHPFMYIYTERRSYRLDLIYGCPIAEGQWRERSFMYAENVASLMSYASNYTTFNSSTSYQSGDRIVVLSTCTFEFNDARYIVIGVLRGL